MQSLLGPDFRRTLPCTISEVLSQAVRPTCQCCLAASDRYGRRDLEQVDDSGQLARAELIEQLVSVLFRFDGINGRRRPRCAAFLPTGSWMNNQSAGDG